MEQTITRKDGITYERKLKAKNYDCNLHIKVDKKTIDGLKTLAKEKNIKYSNLARTLLEDYIKQQENI